MSFVLKHSMATAKKTATLPWKQMASYCFTKYAPRQKHRKRIARNPFLETSNCSICYMNNKRYIGELLLQHFCGILLNSETLIDSSKVIPALSFFRYVKTWHEGCRGESPHCQNDRLTNIYQCEGKESSKEGKIRFAKAAEGQHPVCLRSLSVLNKLMFIGSFP